jgi:hypothetical protein
MINITIQNDDVRDLFVTVIDLNQAVNQVIINGMRFNKGQGSQIAIQDDSDGLGHIRWQTNKADEPLTVRTEEASSLRDGDVVPVSS